MKQPTAKHPYQPHHWKIRFCLEPSCDAHRWFVRQIEPPLWEISKRAERATFKLNADEPICPLCGYLLPANDASEQISNEQISNKLSDHDADD